MCFLVGLSLLAEPAMAVEKQKKAGVAIDTRKGQIRFNGKLLPDFKLKTLKRVLGKPSRVQSTTERVRFERFALRGGRPHSTMVKVKNFHHVYDDRGLVFHTRNRRYRTSREPVRLVVLLRRKIAFTHKRRPRVLPKRLCSVDLWINGVRLDRVRPLVPKAVNYRTARFKLFNTDFAPTSVATAIDSVYSHGGRLAIQIFLDNSRDGRPAYLVIR